MEKLKKVSLEPEAQQMWWWISLIVKKNIREACLKSLKPALFSPLSHRFPPACLLMHCSGSLTVSCNLNHTTPCSSKTRTRSLNHCSIAPPMFKNSCIRLCHLWCLVPPAEVETSSHCEYQGSLRPDWGTADDAPVTSHFLSSSPHFLLFLQLLWFTPFFNLPPFALSVPVLFHMCCICIFMRWQLTWKNKHNKTTMQLCPLLKPT